LPELPELPKPRKLESVCFHGMSHSQPGRTGQVARIFGKSRTTKSTYETPQQFIPSGAGTIL
jgi:hypothetical protein